MPVCTVEAVVDAGSGLFDVAEAIAGPSSKQDLLWAVDCRAVSVASTSLRGRVLYLNGSLLELLFLNAGIFIPKILMLTI